MVIGTHVPWRAQAHTLVVMGVLPARFAFVGLVFMHTLQFRMKISMHALGVEGPNNFLAALKVFCKVPEKQ